jgi:Flp pilus assembly pilin Flp
MSMPTLPKRFVLEEDGQDLVEYAFLTAFIGLACSVAWLYVQQAIATGFTSWDTAEQSLWRPPDPF